MNILHITGFDSAWGGVQKGAICDIWFDKDTDTAVMENAPETVTWKDAVERIDRYNNFSHHVVAVDQGLIVPNMNGMRPVERLLSQALSSMHCSAYPSNRSNTSCFGKDAGIWKFLAQLRSKAYAHSPMAIPKSTTGRFYFECYPHPAIIALTNRNMILQYKCRHKNTSAWDQLLQSLSNLPIAGLSDHLKTLVTQCKANEDKLDSIVCAHTALMWWKYGTDRSAMIGNMHSGYMVTPSTPEMLERFRAIFGNDLNSSAIELFGQEPFEDPITNRPSTQASSDESSETSTEVAIDTNWSEIVVLTATDTSNLYRRMRQQGGPVTINNWLAIFSGYRLIVKFIDESGEPEVSFVPHGASLVQMSLMAERDEQRDLWHDLVSGASRQNPLTFRVKFQYQPLN